MPLSSLVPVVPSRKKFTALLPFLSRVSASKLSSSAPTGSGSDWFSCRSKPLGPSST